MTKKKILVLALTIAMVAILAVGGSLAYLTDTQSATNTFTLGNIKIVLNEQQKGANGEPEAFSQNKVLKPGKSNDGNAVSKIVSVTNDCEEDVWVWVELEIPSYLVSADYKKAPHKDESKNALHWNSYGCFNVEYFGKGYDKLAKADGIIDEAGNTLVEGMVAYNADNAWYDYKFVSANEEYVTIRTMMKSKLPAGKTTLPCLAQVYMDWRVKVDENNMYLLPDGTSISTNTTDKPWKINVKAYAIQADGIDTVEAAVDAYNNNGK